MEALALQYEDLSKKERRKGKRSHLTNITWPAEGRCGRRGGLADFFQC